MAFSLLLVSMDQNVIDAVGSMTEKQNLDLTLQPVLDSVILTTLEKQFHLFLYDMKNTSESHMDTLNVIKNLNPDLPIIVLTEDNSVDTLKNLAQMNVLYSAIKPVQIREIESIVHTIKSAVAA